MSREEMILLVIFMALVTYIPRMLPIVLFKDAKLPHFWRAFFSYIPYAALASLIFPGIIYSTGNMYSAIFGAVVSLILAYYRLNVIIVVFGGIIGAYIVHVLV
ncbi:AzlD domain-containing protein [Methanococcus sp. CF]